jgi:hypothetical protein
MNNNNLKNDGAPIMPGGRQAVATDKSDGLLAKHILLIEVIRTTWATKLDHKIAAEILERYMSKHGNARVSLRYLERATQATRSNIIASLARLTTGGVFTIIREGKGTRPTEYEPNFRFSSGIAGNTSSGTADDTTSRGVARNTSSGPVDDTSKGSSGIAGNTEYHLHNPPTREVTVNNTSATGTGSGLSAAPARASAGRVVRIISSEIQTDDDDDSQWLYMELQDDEGTVEPFAICVHSDEIDVQERGQKRLERLVIALGIDRIDQPNDVIGIPLRITSADDFQPLEAL